MGARCITSVLIGYHVAKFTVIWARWQNREARGCSPSPPKKYLVQEIVAVGKIGLVMEQLPLS